jgi:hypothetical protein
MLPDSIEGLEIVIDVYLIRNRDGTLYAGPRSVSDLSHFILNWLQPIESSFVNSDPVSGILTGAKFNLGIANHENIFKQLGLDHLHIRSTFLDDLNNWPATNRFGPIQSLINGYRTSPDPFNYVYSITGVSGSYFLNHHEALFYLLHGYGRPNRYAGLTDINLRQVYKNASPTALICLNDFFGLCSGKQNPALVREFLSTVDLSSIDIYHRSLVEKISVLCPVSCNPKNMDATFMSIGMLPKYTYNPRTQVYESNLSQISLYRKVEPNIRWDFSIIAGRSDLDIERYINSLPDTEILKISTPSGQNLIDHSEININLVNKRLRSVLVRSAIDFLSLKHYIVYDKIIYYGRRVDTKYSGFTIEKFLEYIHTYKYLVDPSDQPFSTTEAKGILKFISDDGLKTVTDQTDEKEQNYDRLYSTLTVEQKKKLRNTLSTIQKYNFTEDDFKQVLSGFDMNVRNLPMWSGDVFIINCTIHDYITGSNKGISYQTIVDTLNYYLSVL